MFAQFKRPRSGLKPNSDSWCIPVALSIFMNLITVRSHFEIARHLPSFKRNLFVCEVEMKSDNERRRAQRLCNQD